MRMSRSTVSACWRRSTPGRPPNARAPGTQLHIQRRSIFVPRSLLQVRFYSHAVGFYFVVVPGVFHTVYLCLSFFCEVLASTCFAWRLGQEGIGSQVLLLGALSSFSHMQDDPQCFKLQSYFKHPSHLTFCQGLVRALWRSTLPNPDLARIYFRSRIGIYLYTYIFSITCLYVFLHMLYMYTRLSLSLSLYSHNHIFFFCSPVAPTDTTTLCPVAR